MKTQKYFMRGNGKLGGSVMSISCTPIVNCPGAPVGGCKFCGENGKLKTCYAVNIAKRYPSVKQYHVKVDALFSKSTAEIYHTLHDELCRMKNQPRAIRLFGSGGDFSDQRIVRAFNMLANMHPNTVFYAYTKSLHLNFDFLPSNFVVIQSMGGRYDHLIDWTKPVARVFRSAAELEAENAMCSHHGETPWVDGSKDDRPAEQGTQFIALVAH